MAKEQQQRVSQQRLRRERAAREQVLCTLHGCGLLESGPVLFQHRVDSFEALRRCTESDLTIFGLNPKNRKVLMQHVAEVAPHWARLNSGGQPPAPIRKEGFLLKTGGGKRPLVGRKSRKRRFFRLQDCRLQYFEDNLPGRLPLKNFALDMNGEFQTCTNMHHALRHLPNSDLTPVRRHSGTNPRFGVSDLHVLNSPDLIPSPRRQGNPAC